MIMTYINTLKCLSQSRKRKQINQQKHCIVRAEGLRCHNVIVDKDIKALILEQPVLFHIKRDLEIQFSPSCGVRQYEIFSSRGKRQ